MNSSAATSAIPSPCVGVCRLDPAGRQCQGCLRTLQEIAEWPAAADARKREILRELERRRITAGQGQAGPAIA